MHRYQAFVGDFRVGGFDSIEDAEAQLRLVQAPGSSCSVLDTRTMTEVSAWTVEPQETP